MTNPPLDYVFLDKELDRVKTFLFLGNHAAFLGPLMCSVNFLWTEDIKTACTNGSILYWNPHWFMKIPHETRRAVLAHELWHIAFMHMLGVGTKDPKIWNIACDIVINNMLAKEGYTFKDAYPCMDDNLNKWKHPKAPSLGNYGDAGAEEVYECLEAKIDLMSGMPHLWGHEEMDEETGLMEGDETDLIEPENLDGVDVINKVVQATTAAKLAAGPDAVPSEIETMLKRFLQPKLPWEQLLARFFNDLSGQDYSWARPNRRFNDIYLPSLMEDTNALDHIMYFLDVSGSVSDGEVVRFNSEVKHIKDTYNPRRLTLVLFDDQIQRVYEFNEEDRFEEVVIVGRGGTDLEPVRDYIIEHKPTVVIVFSDLMCDPMQPLPEDMDIPTIWVAVNASQNAKVHFGKIIHIKE